MTLGEVRAKYLKFFEERGHTVVPSSSLVPENDPTTLFTGSGMQPLVPYLLGKSHPAGARLVNSQKCFRAMDIEEVGDNRHTTFFEMLGNWSLGDYFKKEQLAWAWEFFTKEIGLPKERLWITCFEGDEKFNISRDTESADIWKSLGVPQERIRFYRAKNWWSRAGGPEEMPAGEPGGPTSEVFYEFDQVEHDLKYGEVCHPNCDCGRFLEIGNSVFMQYVKKAGGVLELLPKQNVDFGGGLERIAAVSENTDDVFLVAHKTILEYLEKASGKKYEDDKKAFRIVADHIKAAVFLIADGVHPDNKDQGYFVRRLLRRGVRAMKKIEGERARNAFTPLHILVDGIIEEYKVQYPELESKVEKIKEQITEEETKFKATLERGLKEFERFVGQGSLSAQDAFQLVTTYGFPLELIVEEAGERGIKQVDIAGFKELLKQHQDLSRAGSEQKFKGGLADTSEKTTRLHTAHHLLLKALQTVLGPQVKQRGSNITGERLRIDFSWNDKMTDEQKREVERIVNEKIKEDLLVVRTEMPKEEAEKLGAEHEFGAKYPDRVSVYSVGPLESAFSIEFCGGPHVEHTGELGKSGIFKIQKEEAVQSGVRRIKAVLE